MSNPAASSSSALGVFASLLDEWCYYLVLVRGDGIADIVGEETVDVSSLPAVAGCRMVTCIPKMAASCQ